MQFIERDPVHVSVRGEIPEIVDTAGRTIARKQRRLSAKFERGIPHWAVPRAESLFDFSTLPPERTVEQWCGFYDSVADQHRMSWTDDERAQIEAELLKRGYTVVEKPKAAVPYPAYLKQRKVHGRRTVEHVIDDIKQTLEMTGETAAAVIGYEQDHPDEHSQAIIAALTETAAAQLEPVEELIEA